MQQQDFDLSAPMNEIDVFHFSDDRPNFNDLSNENGFVFWWATKLAKMLGYQSFKSFQKPINKAIQTCSALGIPILDNFEQAEHEIDGTKVRDTKLSRFACYLVAMNGDPKKPEVARAQAFFAGIAETFRKYVEQAEDVERVLIRDEVSTHETSLNSTAKSSGVHNYAFFQSAGYRGLYNMNLNQLRQRKKIPNKRSPLDFMGKEELAANLFRITQTEAKLKIENTQGQKPAERTAEAVGRTVRETMHRISGQRPENLPPSEDIKKVKSAIKSSKRDFEKLDKK